jgi:hypothetical protein
MSIAAVAREMGLSPSYVGSLLSDPTGRHARKAKREFYESQKGTCPRCGGEISPKAETCAVCQPRLIAVRDSPIVNGCYDRRPPAKRCSGCGVVKDKNDYNTQKIPVKDSDIKALHLKAKCKDCQSEDNKAAIFRRALKKGRVPRYIFMREFEASERAFKGLAHQEYVNEHGKKGVDLKIGGKTYRQTITTNAKVSLKMLNRIEIGRDVSKRDGKVYKNNILTVDIGLLEVVLRMRGLDLRDLDEWDWVIEEGAHYTYIGWQSEGGGFRERVLLPPSRRKRPARSKQAVRPG